VKVIHRVGISQGCGLLIWDGGGRSVGKAGFLGEFCGGARVGGRTVVWGWSGRVTELQKSGWEGVDSPGLRGLYSGHRRGAAATELAAGFSFRLFTERLLGLPGWFSGVGAVCFWIGGI
jgi:hypothetical protein